MKKAPRLKPAKAKKLRTSAACEAVNSVVTPTLLATSSSSLKALVPLFGSQEVHSFFDVLCCWRIILVDFLISC